MKLGPLQKKWIKFLKENGHLQGIGTLGSKKGEEVKLCCLGAAGLEIIKTCKWEKNIFDDDELMLMDEDTSTTLTIGFKSNFIDNTSYNILLSFKKLGLYGANGPTKPPSDRGDSTLAELNDNGTSWYEIACILEAYPELYFKTSK